MNEASSTTPAYSGLGSITLFNNSNNSTADSSADSEETSLFMMVIKGIFMGLLMLMALFGNALVIASVIRIRRLRTITNYFVVSLAVADFLVAALVMPFNATQEISRRWIFPEWVCYFFNSNDVLFCTASVLNLCMVAVDRYVAIVKPLRYHQVMSKRAASLMIASAWTASLAVSYVPIHLNWHLPNFEAVPNPDHCDFKPSAVYSLVSSAISFWAPTFVILFVYGRIYHIAVGQAKEMRRLEKHMATVYSKTDVAVKHSESMNAPGFYSKKSSIASSTAANLCHQAVINGDNNNSNSNDKKRLPALSESAAPPRNNSSHMLHPSSGSFSSVNAITQSKSKATNRSSESRATKVLAIVIGCYLLCWMPFFVWLNVMAICKHCPDSGVLGTILFWIGYANSTLNPVIYAFFSREFRNAFIASLRIDKWGNVRSLCVKLAKNKSQLPASSDRMAFPVSRSIQKMISNYNRNSSSLQLQSQKQNLHSHSESNSDLPESKPLISTSVPPTVPVININSDVIVMHAKLHTEDSSKTEEDKKEAETDVADHSTKDDGHDGLQDERGQPQESIVDQKMQDVATQCSPMIAHVRNRTVDKPFANVERTNSTPSAARRFKADRLVSMQSQNSGDTRVNNNDIKAETDYNGEGLTTPVCDAAALLHHIDSPNECGISNGAAATS